MNPENMYDGWTITIEIGGTEIDLVAEISEIGRSMADGEFSWHGAKVVVRTDLDNRSTVIMSKVVSQRDLDTLNSLPDRQIDEAIHEICGEIYERQVKAGAA